MMNRVIKILRSRERKRARSRSNPLGLIGFLMAALLSITSAGAVIYGVSRYAVLTQDLPTPDLLPILLNPSSGTLLQPTRILDRQGGTVLWRVENPAVPSRRYASITDGKSFFYSEVPRELILATIASLDPDYLERPENFLAAVMDTDPDPIPGMIVEDLLLWQERQNPYHDLRAGLLSDQVVARYGRKKVLEWYLNSADYGNLIYGAPQAARFYFGKDLKDLDLSECALLAAVSTYPSLNPVTAPRAARENQAQILEKMAAGGFITASEAAGAAREQLIYADPGNLIGQGQPAFLDYILQEGSQAIPLDRLQRGGFDIISTIDSQLQDQLECTVESMAQRVEGGEWNLDSSCDAARLLPKYDGGLLSSSQSLELNVALLDPDAGQVLGLAGVNTDGGPLTIEEPRAPGSLVTPFIYLQAFTQGFEPASLVWDIPLPEEEGTAEELHPGCGGACDFLGPVNIRTALVNDLLSPAVQILASQSSSQLRSTLGLFGFSVQPGSCQDCAVFQTSSDLRMIDLMQGYGVFAGQGILKGRQAGGASLAAQPVSILKIMDPAGNAYPLDQTLVEKKVISEELAYLVNQTLSDQRAWLDAREEEFFQVGRPAGVKVGHVPDGSSGWTMGYTPSLVVGTWAGLSSDSGDRGDLDPTAISSSLWRAVTQYAVRGKDVEDWAVPPGITSLDVCYPSGELPTPYCPRTVREIFIEGNQPYVPDTLYQAREVNRETGLLASVFTPADRIEERVFLNVPPLAQDWAEEQGIETPPELYDLGQTSEAEGGLRLNSPDNLSFVHGRVRIIGTIPAEDFVSARLQYGAGINPHSWILIGDEISAPVESGYLGTWDTSQLEEGIYALQLVLIKKNQGIEKASLLLSVDNTPPEIILMTDLSGGEIPYQPGKDLLLEVQFANSAEIKQVDFYLDGVRLDSRSVAPFITPWPMSLGEHHLRVRAVDQAGNQAELEADFRVRLGE